MHRRRLEVIALPTRLEHFVHLVRVRIRVRVRARVRVRIRVRVQG